MTPIGAAGRTIEVIGVSDVNYTFAWEDLNTSYEGTKSFIHHHMNGFTELQILTRDSHIKLHLLINKLSNYLAAFKAFGATIY